MSVWFCVELKGQRSRGKSGNDGEVGCKSDGFDASRTPVRLRAETDIS